MKHATECTNIAFATMVRNEHYFLPKWIQYYSRHVGKDNLYILLDGADQTVPPEADGCQVLALPRRPYGGGWDRNRWDTLEYFAGLLLSRFDVVVLGDVDEFIVCDPSSGESLLGALGRARQSKVISPFAIEVIHRIDLEPPLDPDQPILHQRKYVRINASYCKPCIISESVHWSVGGHYSNFAELHLDTNLYLFHLRFLDRDMLIERQRSRLNVVHQGLANETSGNGEVAGAGWSKTLTEIDDFLTSFAKEGPPIDKNFDFGWQRKKIKGDWKWDDLQGVWKHPRLHNRKTYIIPKRFSCMF